MEVMHVTAKCPDGFCLQVEERTGWGYVPDWFPNPNAENDGDYVILEIDMDTGRILNWKKPTKKNLDETFAKLSKD